jgi:hypothetical protein
MLPKEFFILFNLGYGAFSYEDNAPVGCINTVTRNSDPDRVSWFSSRTATILIIKQLLLQYHFLQIRIMGWTGPVHQMTLMRPPTLSSKHLPPVRSRR